MWVDLRILAGLKAALDFFRDLQERSTIMSRLGPLLIITF